jgi:hypothetical protein
MSYKTDPSDGLPPAELTSLMQENSSVKDWVWMSDYRGMAHISDGSTLITSDYF